MDATFLNDPEYVETCGKRRVQELVSTLCGVFDRHEQAFPPSILEEKTVGKIINIPALTEEISSLESVLVETEGTFEYFWETALYLREKMSTVRERMKSLREKKKEQKKFRMRFKASLRGPTLPREITNTILGLVPSDNMLCWEGEAQVYVDGVAPLAVYTAPLLLPYYEEASGSNRPLNLIALKRTILDDASLTKHIKLRVNFCRDVSELRPLMNYPHLWNTLGAYIYRLVMYDLVLCCRPCFPFLEELVIDAYSVTSSAVDVLLDGRRLRTAVALFRIFPDLFNTGCLESITSLTLYNFNPSGFPNHDAFKQALDIFPRLVSQLSCLYKLEVWHTDYERNDLEGLPRIKSNLHSLHVRFDCDDSVVASAFLSLFAGCNINRISMQKCFIHETSRLFKKAQHVCVEIDNVETPFELEQDGNLVFPEMYQLELSTRSVYSSEIQLQQLQDVLLQTVRTRFENPVARRIHELRIPKKVVTSVQFQEELERYVPSLILTR